MREKITGPQWRLRRRWFLKMYIRATKITIFHSLVAQLCSLVIETQKESDKLQIYMYVYFK